MPRWAGLAVAASCIAPALEGLRRDIEHSASAFGDMIIGISSKPAAASAGLFGTSTSEVIAMMLMWSHARHCEAGRRSEHGLAIADRDEHIDERDG